MARIVPAALLVLLLHVGVALENDVQKNRPVSKVINLLKDIVDQLEKEGEQDEEVYEQMGCWCKTNEKEKTQSITKGENAVEDLSHAIEDTAANSARLNAEISNLNSEVAKNEEALESATALRKKQLAEFTVEEKDMVASLTSLKGAVIALSSHHESALLQQSVSTRELNAVNAIAVIQHQLKHHEDLLGEVISPHQRKVLKSYLQNSNSGDQTAFLQQGQPQSGEIYGILKAMKESFETNLAQSQKEESENNNAYEDLKKAKKAEIKAGKDQSDTKTDELAASDEKNAQSKQDLEDTRNTLAADIEYLANLKETCQNIDHQYEERTTTRQLEIQATTKALAFLSSDEAHDLFTRTFNPALLQKSSFSAQRLQLSQMLTAAAKKSKDPRVALLSTNSKIAAFGKVKKSIQDMIDKLTQEKEDEIKKKDYCVETITEIDSSDLPTKQRDRGDLEVVIEDLHMSIDQLAINIEELKSAIAEAQTQLKRAGIDREKANQEFMVVVADQRATGKLLTAALNVLKGFYDKAALLQAQKKTAQPAGPPPPPGFKTYEKSSSSGGVMGMMQTIINDAKAMEEEAVRGEADAQKDYEKFVSETNASIDAMNTDMSNKGGAKAKAESDLVERQAELNGKLDEILQLEGASKDIHYECDFLLKNFDLRQSTRDDEVYSLQQSLAIFSGASFGAFLQGQ
jgi:hypothetical protein